MHEESSVECIHLDVELSNDREDLYRKNIVNRYIEREREEYTCQLYQPKISATKIAYVMSPKINFLEHCYGLIAHSLGGNV